MQERLGLISAKTDHNVKLGFQFIGNACGIFIGNQGTRLLCDPWLLDGVFEGSWCHYPKLKTTIDDVLDVDALYVSHLHPDHFDERTFRFDKNKPIIILDHPPNFLTKKLEALGYRNLIKLKDKETTRFNEFDITLFAPFAKHPFHETKVGNLIDSAMLVACAGVSAFNANDNRPTVEAAQKLRETYGEISLAMLNYNAAGPYPSCFDNLSDSEKHEEHRRILLRNFEHVRELVLALKPRRLLPFAGAYVLGGKLRHKNAYLGTTTWDECAAWLKSEGIGDTEVVLLREGDLLDIGLGRADKEYVPIDRAEMERYIAHDLATLRYPYEDDPAPIGPLLVQDARKAAELMKQRMSRFGISSDFTVVLRLFGKSYKIYPEFETDAPERADEKRLQLQVDERLLRRIFDRKSQWNNAEIGAHVSYVRTPNIYEFDLHTALQFFHL